MSLNLGLSRLGVSRGGGGGVTLASGRVLNLDMTTGQDYEDLSVTTSSAVGLVPVYAGDGVKSYVPKTAWMLAGWDGVRVIQNYIYSNALPSWLTTSNGTGVLPVVTLVAGAGRYGGDAYRVTLSCSSSPST
jgi:hypothetical protein